MSSSIKAVDPAYGEALVPETCCLVIPSTILVEDRIRQAKAEFPLVLIARIKAWLHVLAIAGLVASADDRFDPAGEIFKPFVTGPDRNRLAISLPEIHWHIGCGSLRVRPSQQLRRNGQCTRKQ